MLLNDIFYSESPLPLISKLHRYTEVHIKVLRLFHSSLKRRIGEPLGAEPLGSDSKDFLNHWGQTQKISRFLLSSLKFNTKEQVGSMARLPRFGIPGQPQHVIQRGNNRSAIFVSNKDYCFYLEKLHDACKKHNCDLHAYVLMTNHVHLLMTPHTNDGISKVMQSLGRYYVQYFNYTYERTGTLWEGRYKATLIDTEAYLLTCSRYIELNPVRAHMVSHPSEYPWSSFQCNALGKYDSLISSHLLYKRLGKTDEERQKSYRQLFRSRIPEKTLVEIREATNKAWVLGDDHFRAKIEKLISRQAQPKVRGGDRKSKEFRKSKTKRV